MNAYRLSLTCSWLVLSLPIVGMCQSVTYHSHCVHEWFTLRYASTAGKLPEIIWRNQGNSSLVCVKGAHMSLSTTAPVPQCYILVKPNGQFLKGNKLQTDWDCLILTTVIPPSASLVFCIIALSQSFPIWNGCLESPPTKIACLDGH